MPIYAFINNGVVWEIVQPSMSLAEVYSPEYVAACIDVTEQNPRPQSEWAFTNGVFSAPASTLKVAE
jgi:hypothetical protein